jgi:hypothetical protein
MGLDSRLYSAPQVLAEEGKLPLDHPSWRDPNWADKLRPSDEAADDSAWADLEDLVDDFTETDDARPATCCFAHCASCGRHFGGVSAFDMHWVGRDGNRHCVDPASRKGLVHLRDEVGRTVWSRPYTATRKA